MPLCQDIVPSLVLEDWHVASGKMFTLEERALKAHGGK